MIIRGGTPTLTISVKSNGQVIDLSSYSKVEFYLAESSSELKSDMCESSTVLTIDKTRMSFDSTTHKITITLTQQETLKLHSNDVFYQIRALNNGNVLTTNIGSTSLGKILRGDVL